MASICSVFRINSLRWLPYGNDIIVRYARFPRLLLFTAAIYRRCTTSCTHRASTRALVHKLHERGNAWSFGFTVDCIIIIIIAILSLGACHAWQQHLSLSLQIYKVFHYYLYFPVDDSSFVQFEVSLFLAKV
jgi:hypothetical protein